MFARLPFGPTEPNLAIGHQTRKCGNCGQVGHMSKYQSQIILTERSSHLPVLLPETNRKCPRWAEFNTDGGPISAGSPPGGTNAGSPPAGGSMAMSPPSSSVGRDAYFGNGPPFMRHPSTSFNMPSVPSPLATSPPMSAPNDWSEGPMSPGASGSAPKKLMLKVKK